MRTSTDPRQQSRCFHAFGAISLSLFLFAGVLACGEDSSKPEAVVDAGTPQDGTDAGPQPVTCQDDSACAVHQSCADHVCTDCPPTPEDPACQGGAVVSHPYGNECTAKYCCLAGTAFNNETHECDPVPIYDLADCPSTVTAECLIRFFSAVTESREDPIPAIQTETSSGGLTFSIRNSGQAPLIIDDMGFEEGASASFTIVSPTSLPITIRPGDPALPIVFKWDPESHGRHQRAKAVFYTHSNAFNGENFRAEVWGDTYWTTCSTATVADDCIPYQLCDYTYPDDPTCNDCVWNPERPLCVNGHVAEHTPDGTFRCIEFICYCPADHVWIDGETGCVPVKPCDHCQDCQTLCTQRGMDPNCAAANQRQHCMDP